MWISKKRWKALEKKVADLEEQIQCQQEKVIFFLTLFAERQQLLSKSGSTRQKD